MAYTAGFSVSVGDPTKASDVTTLAANDDYLKAAVDGKAALSGTTNDTVATVTGANALVGEADLTFASNKLTAYGPDGSSGAGSAGVLNLAPRETGVVDADQLGRIEFQAPAEIQTGDARLVTASIYAEADVTFDATHNATDLVLATAHDGAAGERFRITSQGEIGLAGANYGSDGQVLTSAGAGAAAAWEAIPAGITLSGSTPHTVATVTGANALEGEANLTFDGSTLTVAANQVINAGYGLRVGSATEVTSALGIGEVQINGTANADTQLFLGRWVDNLTGPTIVMNTSRSGTVGGTTIVQDGDYFGQIYFTGSDGSSNDSIGAIINGRVDGTPGDDTDMPGSLEFGTTPEGSASPTIRMTIDNAGDVHIKTANALLNVGNLASKTVSEPTIQLATTGERGGFLTNVSSSELYM